MRGQHVMKEEPVIKSYVSQIIEKLTPFYLKVKSFVGPQTLENCKVDDVVQEV